MALKLHVGVGAIIWVMSKFVHPSKPIREQYPNRAKNHKLEGVVLVKEENKDNVPSHCPIAYFKMLLPKLHAGVGAIAWVMLKFVHPSKPICKQSTNRTRTRTYREIPNGWALLAWWGTGSNCSVPEATSKKKVGNIIDMEPDDVGRPRQSTMGPRTIVPCALQKVKEKK
eukprot:scaffold79600_cov65-Attheya_sp.AAC.1